MKQSAFWKTLIIMQLGAILILASCLHLSAGVFAQQFSVSEDRTDLVRIFELIEKETEYTVVYRDEWLHRSKPFSLHVKNISLEELLNRSFEKQPLTYALVNKTIVVRPRSMRPADPPAQTGTLLQEVLRGVVKEAGSGAPLPGVSIVVKGSTVGTSTDLEGRFELSGVTAGQVLVLTFLGFRTKEVPYRGEETLDITLEEDVAGLDEVVVIGYGTQQSRDLTGSVATIDQKTIRDLPVATIDQKMVGQVPGVQIQQVSGAPGAGTSVKIRGSGSLGAGNEPLYVVDGMPYSAGMNQNLNPLAYISPSNVESITILKDASSTAIYGSRGANGVVMITTKKGGFNQNNVTVSSMYGIQHIPQRGRPKLLNQREFAELQQDKIRIVVRQRENREATLDDFPEAYRYPDQLVGEGTDWYDLLLQTAATQDHTININSGNDRTRFNLGLGYFQQDGALKHTGMKRYSASINGETRLGPVKIGASLQPSFVDQVRTQTNTNRLDVIGISLWANPLLSPYDENGELIPYLQAPSSPYHSAWSFPNPLFVLRESTASQQNFRNLGSAHVEWEIIPGLKAKTALNTIWTTGKANRYIPGTVGSANSAPTGIGRSTNGRNSSFNWLIENTVNYTREFGEHRINLLGGYTAQKSTSDGISLNAEPYPNDLIKTINAAQDILAWGQDISAWSMISYLGRANYVFRDRYLLTATFRSDGSSRFGRHSRFASFPSLAVAWHLSEEPFLENNRLINNLKVRLSYGKSGNNNIGDYTHLASVSAGSYLFGGNQVTGSRVGLPNPFLTWEESDQLDAGLDIDLFDSRLALTIDAYHRKSKNMLLEDVVPAITGFTSQLVNSGSVRNNGLEIGLVAVPVTTQQFNWTFSGNVSFNRNKVLSLNSNGDRILAGNNDGYPTHVSVVGKPIGQFFGFIFERLYNQADMDDPNLIKTPQVYPGNPKYADIDGDGVITDLLDYTIIGNPHPDFLFGFSNTFSYSNFDLMVLVNGQSGGSVINGVRQTVDNLMGFFNVSKEWTNRWKSEQDPGDGKHYGIPQYAPSWGHRRSTLWVEDASYLRIANVTLGYSLPAQTVERLGVLQSCRLYFTVQNLAMFTKYGGANPEGQASNISNTRAPGYDMTSYPLARTFSMGLNLTF